MTKNRFFPFVVLFIAVLIVSTASILIRMAQAEGAPSLAVATWRMIMSGLILTPIAWGQRGDELRRLRKTDIIWGIASGSFLAIHMATWVSSLAYTSVASSVALVTTNPLWIALITYFFFGERISRNTGLGVAAALTGSLLLALSDGGVLTLEPGLAGLRFNWRNLIAPAGKADTALLGDGLALIGAITAAAYLLIGRNLRARLTTTAYVWLSYSSAMLLLTAFSLVAGIPFFGYTWMAFVWFLLLAIGPQLMGHTSFNWALAHLSATFVAISILGEPIGSSLLAYFIFGETFAPLQFAGFTLLLAGIGLGVLGEQYRRKAAPE